MDDRVREGYACLIEPSLNIMFICRSLSREAGLDAVRAAFR
jgi:hypothetical protein